MNRQQAIALWLVVANLALIFAFPPYDYLTLARGSASTFGGFHFIGAPPPNSLLNGDLLALEMIVALVNAGIAWLLLRGETSLVDKRITRGQRGVLWLVAVNLVLILLFPPFESRHTVTQAALPSFDAFYFIFGDNAERRIVTTLLYIEVALVLVNGGLLWLLFADRRLARLSYEEKQALLDSLRERQP
jgi:hypothetical protein